MAKIPPEYDEVRLKHALVALDYWLLKKQSGIIEENYITFLWHFMQAHYLDSLCAVFSEGKLPEAWQKQFSDNSKEYLLTNAKYYELWKSLKETLKKNNIKFCPSGDCMLFEKFDECVSKLPIENLEILVPNAEFDKVKDLIVSDGWKQDFDYKHQQMLPSFVRDKMTIRVFTHVPHWENADCDLLWDEFIHAENPNEVSLPLEFSVAEIFCRSMYRHWHAGLVDIVKILLLIRDTNLNIEAIKKLSNRFKIANIGLLFAAFPEFFPEEIRQHFLVPPKICIEFRKLIADGDRFVRHGFNRSKSRLMPQFNKKHKRIHQYQKRGYYMCSSLKHYTLGERLCLWITQFMFNTSKFILFMKKPTFSKLQNHVNNRVAIEKYLRSDFVRRTINRSI